MNESCSRSWLRRRCRAGGDFDTTRFVGLDFDDPAIDLDAIMRGFGATTERLTALAEVADVVERALARRGPTVLFVDRRP